MSDIALVPAPDALGFDLLLESGDLRTDAGMATAIIISLFTDALARSDDVIPDGTDDRRGWWGDFYAETAGDQIGSRRWLLARAKLTPETLNRLRDYDLEALKWLVDDQVAAAIDIIVQRRSDDPDRVDEVIIITRPDGSVSRFSYVWGVS